MHSVYGPELGYSSNDEGPTSLCVVDGPGTTLAGDASPVSDLGQLIPPPAATSSSSERSHVQQPPHSSPSPSLHSAQTSNDDESVPQVTATRAHNPRLRHLNHTFNQLNSHLHQVGCWIESRSLTLRCTEQRLLFTSFPFRSPIPKRSLSFCRPSMGPACYRHAKGNRFLFLFNFLVLVS